MTNNGQLQTRKRGGLENMIRARQYRRFPTGRRLACASAALALAVLVVTAIFVFAVPSVQAQTLKTLYTFGGTTDGGYPNALVRDAAGNLYGTTISGGVGTCADGDLSGCGVVFRVTPAGKETVLYSFTGGADGAAPQRGLLLDAKGNLYGTTASGGTYGFGTVFKVDQNGNETVLYSFTGGADGGNPYSGLVRDAQGNLYGVAGSVVFKLDEKGNETVLYTFTGGADGSPNGRLMRDANGNLYGTTAGGGTYGFGKVYKLDTSGKEHLLYSFCPQGGVCADGAVPFAGVIQDTAGNLYGTTSQGGTAGWGTVFELNTSGKEKVLHSFTYGDGALPSFGVIRDTNGNLYGTTVYGGIQKKTCTLGCGVIFRVTKAGKESTLYSFTFAEGANPEASVIRDAKGNLYGTTVMGHFFGTVFRLTP
jgi:uncharacterized repeat protein (TIGR03803 family)